MENNKDKLISIGLVFVIIIASIIIVANMDSDEVVGETQIFTEEEIERPEVIIYNESIDAVVAAPSGGFGVFQGVDYNDHPFDVDERATHVNVTLDGDEGESGLNDLDMELFGARDGRTKSSAGGGPDEHIELFQKDVVRMGYGEYVCRVKNFAGQGPIQYNLLIEIFSNITSENETDEENTEQGNQKVTRINLKIELSTRGAIFYRY